MPGLLCSSSIVLRASQCCCCLSEIIATPTPRPLPLRLLPHAAGREEGGGRHTLAPAPSLRGGNNRGTPFKSATFIFQNGVRKKIPYELPANVRVLVYFYIYQNSHLAHSGTNYKSISPTWIRVLHDKRVFVAHH